MEYYSTVRDETVIWHNMDGPGKHDTESNKSDRESQTAWSHHMSNLQ